MGEAGFDAVVGNPPWVNAWQMTESDAEGSLRDGIKRTNPFSEVLEGHWDLYVPFLLKSYALVRNKGHLSFIIPNAFSREKYAEPVRDLFLTHSDIKSVAPSGDINVFSGVSRQTIIPVILKSDSTVEYGPISIDEDFIQTRKRAAEPKTVEQSTFYETPGHQIRYGSGLKELELLQYIDENCIRMGNICYVNYGAQISSKEKGGFGKSHFLSEEYKEGYKKFFEGKNISRYHIEWPEIYLDYQPSEIYGPRHPKLFESEKIAVRYVSADDDSILAAFDEEGMYTDHLTVLCTMYDNVEGTDLRTNYEGFDKLETDYSLKAILAIINSSVDNFYYANRFATGSLQGDYSHVYPQSVRKFPLPSIDLKNNNTGVEDKQLIEIVTDGSPNRPLVSSCLMEDGVIQAPIAHRCLEIACDYLIDKNDELVELNLNLRDHLSNYDIGQTLTNIGFIQPPKNANESMLEQTSEDWPNLRIGDVSLIRESPNTVLIEATARYKPDDEDAHETDQWGYTETAYLPAFRITDLTEREADLIEHFVPVAVDEAGGFANFRETATKTNSLVDRLKAIKLPDVDDVADDLENYLETKERSEELDAKIEQTDTLIDEIVYELYGLTDEEIEIVEEAVEN